MTPGRRNLTDEIVGYLLSVDAFDKAALAKMLGVHVERAFNLTLHRAFDVLLVHHARVFQPDPGGAAGCYRLATGDALLDRSGRFRRAARRKLGRAANQLASVNPADLTEDGRRRLLNAGPRIGAEIAALGAAALRSPPVVAPASNLPPSPPKPGQKAA